MSAKQMLLYHDPVRGCRVAKLRVGEAQAVLEAAPESHEDLQTCLLSPG